LQAFVKGLDTKGLSAHEIKEAIFADVRQFAGTARQFDDMTIVVVKVE
jgi:serine phosphatase RsbU (regulator of sigma subunit)